MAAIGKFTRQGAGGKHGEDHRSRNNTSARAMKETGSGTPPRNWMERKVRHVQALRNYKAQEVKGGLGTGGRLGVQGGSTPASKKTK